MVQFPFARLAALLAEYGLLEREVPAGVAVAIYSTPVSVKAASVRNSWMQALILNQDQHRCRRKQSLKRHKHTSPFVFRSAPLRAVIAHLSVSYRNQVVWQIPEELMKGVS
jgi:hypothetical protein